MIKLKKPAPKLQRKLYEYILESVRKEGVPKKLSQSIPYLKRNGVVYNYAGLYSSMYALEERGEKSPQCTLSFTELKWLYDQQVVKGGGRRVYDIIRGAPQNNICPYCSVRTVWTLDHYLPKNDYPTYSTVVYNLVPSCEECNKVKLADNPGSKAEQVFHPYYDNFDNVEWLSAEVVEGEVPTFRFYVANLDNIDRDTGGRIVSHFDGFKLCELYSCNAGSKVGMIKHALKIRLESGGKEGVKDYLEDEAESYRARKKNTWEEAMYRACLRSDWFCEGGFLSEFDNNDHEDEGFFENG